jgi:Domain of unknown function (DUF3859)
MRTVLALLLLVACTEGSYAQGGKVERIEIVETGIYRAETASIEYAPDTATRQRNILSETQILVATTRIEAKVGLHFGMRYRVVGRPNGVTVRLTSVTQFPGSGLKNPATGRLVARGEHPLFATVGAINYRGYVFEHDWEVAPGLWTFELWDGKRKLASQAFNVIKP